jgi:hypothetical protein
MIMSYMAVMFHQPQTETPVVCEANDHILTLRRVTLAPASR